MKKLYIVLNESNHHGWIGYFETLAKVKRLLKIENEIFYIFELSNRKKNNFMIKIKYPLGEYYKCLEINEYKEEEFDKDDDFITLEYNDTCDKDCLILKHKP